MPYGTPQIYTASASANGGRSVPRVELFFDGVKAGEDTRSPYTLAISGPAEPGPHQLLARAIDFANAATDVSTIVELTDPIGTPPQVFLSFPTAGFTARVGESISALAPAQTLIPRNQAERTIS